VLGASIWLNWERRARYFIPLPAKNCIYLSLHEKKGRSLTRGEKGRIGVDFLDQARVVIYKGRKKREMTACKNHSSWRKRVKKEGSAWEGALNTFSLFNEKECLESTYGKKNLL